MDYTDPQAPVDLEHVRNEIRTLLTDTQGQLEAITVPRIGSQFAGVLALKRDAIAAMEKLLREVREPE